MCLSADAVCGKPWGKVLPILITLTSRSDSNFERSNISLKETKPDGVIRTLTVSTTAFEITKEKFDGFRQTGVFHWLSASRMLSPLNEPLIFRTLEGKIIQSKRWRSPSTRHAHARKSAYQYEICVERRSADSFCVFSLNLDKICCS